MKALLLLIPVFVAACANTAPVRRVDVKVPVSGPVFPMPYHLPRNIRIPIRNFWQPRALPSVTA